MRVVALKESWPGERRAALVPDSIKKLVKRGYVVSVESNIGADAGIFDTEYQAAGASVENDRVSLLTKADVVLSVRRPSLEEVEDLSCGSTHIGFLDPFTEKEVVQALSEQKITAVSLEMIPRSTRAQKMDALSSQASLAGYVTVLLAARYLPRIFPMMMTPAGTLPPARVFVIGAGVAGLQAIATAGRLGARVEAFDTRPAVAEQVRSLGAKYTEIDIGESGQTERGYAKALTEEQLEMQKRGMAAVIERSDVVITTAQVFGRPAPKIVTTAMVESMKSKSVVVDMAVESGGNVECSELDKIVDVNGVTVIGLSNLPSIVARHASDMYSSNLTHLIEDFTEGESGVLNLDGKDEIVASSVLTRDGAIVNESVFNA